MEFVWQSPFGAAGILSKTAGALRASA